MHSRTAAKDREILGLASFFGPAYREREIWRTLPLLGQPPAL